MKRKILSVLIAISTLFICMFTLTACNKVEFKVNFVVDGTVYSIIDTNGQEIIKMPENPTKENYIFDGWFWDNGTWQKPFTANSLLDAPLSSDMNVYCKWKEIDTFDTIIFNTLNVNEENVYGKVSNDTSTFSFIDEITENGNATYKVYKEITCETEIISKTISLNVGDNTVYILQTVGKDIKLYTVTVRRKPLYTVTFDTNGGSSVQTQQVEEGGFATMPDTIPIKKGYIFKGWAYDFLQPITKTFVVNAVWTEDWEKIFNVDNGEIKGLIYDDKSLTKIIIPSEIEGVVITSIGDYAFAGFSLLTNIEIPNSITNIGVGTFNGCDKLQYNIQDNLKYLGNSSNKYLYLVGATATNITDVNINANCKVIGYHAFYECMALTTVEIPNGITNINWGAFGRCYSLKNIKIPNSITNIGNYAFDECWQLESVVIPNSVTKIEWYAFYGCTSLTINCEVDSKPSEWGARWNVRASVNYGDGFLYCPVIWGYKAEN